MKATATSCGVLVRVADGRLLLGQATGSARWDIPKGLAGPGEAHDTAAARELREETGLVADPAALRPLGTFAYLPGKRLALFAWEAGAIDPASLRCTSTFIARDGRVLPELSRFALVDEAEALRRVGKNMARVLGGLFGPPSISP